VTIRPGDVDCGSCVACCRRENVLVSVGYGDNPADFVVEKEVRPGVFAVAAQPNGDCHYLDHAGGCRIYARRPMMCRSFDCRIEASYAGAERREVVDRGLVDRAVMRAGRERLRAMSPAARAALLANFDAARRRPP
jgi:Fe-S-cluster containining protein